MSRLARWLHKHDWLSALLLGCLVLRAFVPTGYMIDTAGGDLGLKMCSGVTLAAPALDGDADNGTRPPGNDGPTGHQGACPAGVPLLVLAYALTLSTDLPARVDNPPPANDAARSSLPPSPSRLPRGPPFTLS